VNCAAEIEGIHLFASVFRYPFIRLDRMGLFVAGFCEIAFC
jgi:hypothetical protein